MAAATPGLACLGMQAVRDNGCCPPQPAFTSAANDCCDEKLPASALIASGAPIVAAPATIGHPVPIASSERPFAPAPPRLLSLPLPILRV